MRIDNLFLEISTIIEDLKLNSSNKNFDALSIKIDELKNAFIKAQSIDEMIFQKEYEKHLLNKLNLSELVDFIKNESSFENFNIIGHYASIFKEILCANTMCLGISQLRDLPLLKNKDDYILVDNLFATLPTCENLIVLNPLLSDYLALKGKIADMYRRVKSKLMLITGPEKSQSIQVSWSDGFFTPEIAENKYFRWCTDNSATNYISIKNNTSENATANISFTANSMVFSTYLEVKFKEEKINYCFNGTPFTFDQSIVLTPGDNLIEFYYKGESLKVENDSREFFFRVDNLKIALENATYQDAHTHVDCGDFALSYSCASDQITRKNLHKNGFFEVVSYNITEDGSIKQCETSRFVSNTDSFAITDVGEKTSPLCYRIYIGKRKGEYEDDN